MFYSFKSNNNLALTKKGTEEPGPNLFTTVHPRELDTCRPFHPNTLAQPYPRRASFYKRQIYRATYATVLLIVQQSPAQKRSLLRDKDTYRAVSKSPCIRHPRTTYVLVTIQRAFDRGSLLKT